MRSLDVVIRRGRPGGDGGSVGIAIGRGRRVGAPGILGLPYAYAAFLMILLSGCVLDPGTAPLPEGDPATFVDSVQPVLSARCANPACHGTVDRPFPVFAPGLHRLDPDERYLDTPLSEHELDRNQSAAEAMLASFAAAADSPLLTKPLAPARGGSDHSGGVQFADPTEAEYLALLHWADAAIDATADTP